MWNLINIPKIVHFYWGRTPLSFLRYLSVASFAKFNPDWDIRIYRVVESQKVDCKSWDSGEHNTSVFVKDDYFDWLYKIKNVNIIDYTFPDNIAHWNDVQKSDYLRVILLYNTGGLWSDFDILYARPIINLSANHHQNSKYCVLIICHSEKIHFTGHSIGFLGSMAGNTLLHPIMHSIINSCNNDNYQSIGCILWNAHLNLGQIQGAGRSVINLETDSFYLFNCTTIGNSIGNRSGPIGEGVLGERNIGIHWYAGDVKMGGYCSTIDHTNYHLMGKLYTSIIDHVLDK